MKFSSLLVVLPFLKGSFAGISNVLVASGNGFLSSVEVLNLNNANSTCKNLPELPLGLEGATGKLIGGSIPVLCGGYKSSKAVDSCECFAFRDESWNPIQSLSECRRYPASAILKTGIFNGDKQEVREYLVVAGGEDDIFGTRSSVEIFDGLTWSTDKIAPMPKSVWLHCLVQLNNTHLFSIGGYDTEYLNSTFFYDLENQAWIPGPTLNTARYGHSCGILPGRDQRPDVLVVAGGFNGRLLTSVELLFGDNLSEFVMGPELPRPISLSQMVEYEKGLIIVGGGYGTDGYQLYRLDSDDGDWIELPQRIIEKRRAHVAFLIPDELVQCT